MKARGSSSAGISGAMALRLVRLFVERGEDTAPLLAALGATEGELRLPSCRIPYAALDRAIEAAASRVGSAGLGAALARVRDEETYGVAALLLLAGPSFGEGLARAIAYQRVWGDGERFTLGALRGGLAARFEHPGRSALARAVLAECALVEIVGAVRLLTGRPAEGHAVQLRHDRLGSDEALCAALGVSPAYGRAENALALPAEVVERPVAAHPELLGRALERIALTAVAALPASASLADRIGSMLRAELDVAAPRLESVARRLHMSARTLQRRLQQEGTSFQDLVDRERRARAIDLIDRGASAKEAALLVGFAEPGSLARARKRWSAGARGG
ncbi:AraC family transcriptional regulator ligand-binding domain-containing protein [Sorangium sp. So ce260]|uniref:AraC family transcriptional regulator ligand-binding domain-containing protein n=1 Tax=Sorangium sp. So ce260 TaxID=3133291 RepID=UPI003F5ECF73